MEFNFSDVGEGIEEGEVVNWLVEENDEVSQDQTLLEVETDKAIVELPSPCSGTIENICIQEGKKVQVGETLVVIDSDDEDENKSDSSDDSEDEGTVVGNIPDEDEEIAKRNQNDQQLDSTVAAVPKARKMAKEKGVDLSTVKGTGANGQIMPSDVKKQASTDTTKEELSGVRREVAQTMKASQEVPQVTHMDEVDITELINADTPNKTLTPFFAKALAKTLQDYKNFNAFFENNKLQHKDEINLGVAVDTEDGLIVPVVENADDKSLDELSNCIDQYAQQARNRTIERSKLKGGTFTLTNIGVIGGTWATPLVLPPQVGILATGQTQKKPAFSGNEVVEKSFLPVSLSFDHRVLDGADAARFINDFKTNLVAITNESN